MRTLKLISGHEIPMLGLGTWQLRGERCTQAVRQALELGYPHRRVQKGMVVIPKARSRAHLEENRDIFEWTLAAEEVEYIDGLNGGSIG
jgi:diketogulonate reductase-like aldo/keto reductase